MKKNNKKYKKSMKIISILSEFKDLPKSKLLDIGCGNGRIIQNLSKNLKETVGVDIIDRREVFDNYKFKLVKTEKLPFKDNSFDIVISNQVIEHVNDQDKHIIEIHRVLKSGGVCYMATPNRYWPIEPHYYLPFLGILPNKLSNFYLNIFWDKDYDIKLLSYKQLIDKLKKNFILYNYTLKVIQNPIKYNLDSVYKFIPKFLIGMHNWDIIKLIVPSFIFILIKK